jgi:hypothetical protein
MMDKRKGEVKEKLLQVIMSEIHGTKTKIVDLVELFLFELQDPEKVTNEKEHKKSFPFFILDQDSNLF